MSGDNEIFQKLREVDDHAFIVGDEIAKIIMLVNGQGENGECWAYVLMTPSKAREYKALEGSEEVDLEDFGEIIFSGDGEFPPEDIIIQMKEKYSIINDYEEQIDKIISDQFSEN